MIRHSFNGRRAAPAYKIPCPRCASAHLTFEVRPFSNGLTQERCHNCGYIAVCKTLPAPPIQPKRKYRHGPQPGNGRR